MRYCQLHSVFIFHALYIYITKNMIDSPLPCFCILVLLYPFASQPLCLSAPVSLYSFFSTLVPLYPCTTLPLYLSITAPLYHRTSLLYCYYSTSNVPLYFCAFYFCVSQSLCLSIPVPLNPYASQSLCLSTPVPTWSHTSFT